jgi:exosortase
MSAFLNPVREGGRGAARLRYTLFLALWLLSLAPFQASLLCLWKLSLADDRYSHTVLMPLLGAGLVYLDQRNIFREVRFCPWLGGAALAAAMFLYRAAPAGAAPDGLTLRIFAVALAWMASFVLCYGPGAWRRAAYPAALLLLMVPWPAPAMENASAALQAGSAAIAHALFQLFGAPVFRQGMVFTLPGATIEVAEACSGIRSTIALLIGSALTGRLCLHSTWRRAALLACTMAAGVFKNALRIVTLAWLGSSVDPGILHGPLHHRYGGIVFSALALALLTPALLLLRMSERRAAAPPL